MSAATPVTIATATTSGAPVAIPQGGATLITSKTGTTVTLCTTSNFRTGATWELGPGSSLPWPVGPLWARAPKATQFLVLAGLYNFANPNVTFTPTGKIKITGPVTSNILNDVPVKNASSSPILVVGDYKTRLDVFTQTTTSARWLITLTPTSLYSTFLVAVTPGLGAIPYSCKVSSHKPGTPLNPSQIIFSSAFSHSAGTTTMRQASLPAGYAIGDRVQFAIYFSQATKGTATIYGMTNDIMSGLVRTDGRVFPVGSLGVTKESANHTALTIIPANATLRIFLSSLYAVRKTGTTGAAPKSLQATINGTTITLAIRLLTTTSLPIPPSGLLLDINTSLRIPVSTTTHGWYITATYDLIP